MTAWASDSAASGAQYTENAPVFCFGPHIASFLAVDSFFTRYRNLVVLAVVLVAQIMGLAIQVRRFGGGHNSLDVRDGSGVRIIRLWAEAAVSPFERAIHGSGLTASDLWSNYADLRHVRQQNQQLQQTIDRLRLEQAALLEDAKQGQRLQAMLDFQQKYIYSTLAAQVIGSSGSELSHVFYIDKGEDYKLKPDMAVITGDGIVGKVRDVFPHTAQVLAINDQTSGAGVILATTRIRGILRGDPSGRLMVVGVLSDERIQPGETVATAGGDLIFPRGLPVGAVDKVVRDPLHDGFIDIMVKPAAHLDRLDEVLVITSTQPRFNDQEQKDIDTSQAEKGADAQAIRDQLKASQIMAEHLPGLIDPNLPPDKQPLNDTSNPDPVKAPPQPLHPDRFTPGNGVTPAATAPDSTDSNAAATGDQEPKTAKTTQPHTAATSDPKQGQAKPGQAKPNRTAPNTPAQQAPPQGNR
jgi:rod shape-determining protein MreC